MTSLATTGYDVAEGAEFKSQQRRGVIFQRSLTRPHKCIWQANRGDGFRVDAWKIVNMIRLATQSIASKDGIEPRRG